MNQRLTVNDLRRNTLFHVFGLKVPHIKVTKDIILGDLDKDYGKERLYVNVKGNQPMIDPLLMIHMLGFVGGSIMVRFP